MAENTITPEIIIKFWYTPPMSKHWFRATPEIDQAIRERFESTWKQAANGELNDWRETPEGCLALCIILDQFPLNMFRGQARCFSTEQQAIEICKYAVANGFDKQLPQEQVSFLYMPLMHSENMADQNEAIRLFEVAGLKNNARFAHHHRGIIERFGRFPHRNELLERKNTADEITYLNSDKAFKG